MLRIVMFFILIHFQINAMVESDSFLGMINQIGFSEDSIGLSTCTKLANGIFLGIYHGAYPSGYNFSSECLSKDEIVNQAAAQKSSPVNISSNWPIFALLTDFGTQLYVAEKENGTFRANKVIGIHNINADSSRTEKSLTDGAILLFIDTACPLNFRYPNFWTGEHEVSLLRMSYLKLNGIVPTLKNGSIVDWQEVTLAFGPLFCIDYREKGFLYLNNLTATSGLSGGLIFSENMIVGVISGDAQNKSLFDVTIGNNDNLLERWSNELSFKLHQGQKPGEVTIELEKCVAIKPISPNEFLGCLAKVCGASAH